MPMGLSDFTATYFDGSITGSEEKDEQRSIVLLGGCSAETGNKYLLDLGGFYCTDFSNRAHVFLPGTQEFTHIAEMPEARTRHTAAAVNGKLYVIGGRSDVDSLLTDVIVYDPATKKWETYITLDANHETSDHGSVVRDGKIFVFGGWTSFYEAKTTVFSIDTMDNGKIKDLEPMPTARGDLAAVHYDQSGIDSAYVIGGFSHKGNYCEPLATVESYDFKSDSWTLSKTETDLGSERGDKIAVVVDKQILAIGGEDKHEDMCDVQKSANLDPHQQSVAVDEVEIFNPKKSKDGWDYESDMPEIRFRAAGALDEKENVLYVFGGQKSFDADCNCYKVANEMYSFEGDHNGGLSTTGIALISVACVVSVLGLAFVLYRRRTGRE